MPRHFPPGRSDVDPPARPAADGWLLRGASLALWGGELVCIAGTDLSALCALTNCLRGGLPWSGQLRTRSAWWRLGRVEGPLMARGRSATWIAGRLLALERQRAVGGATVCALALDEAPAGWTALRRAAALVSSRAPLRCVRLAGGRLLPPPRSVDPPPGDS
jgi:hypothetical protein